MGAQAGLLWLLITAALLCLWCSDCSFALPIGTKVNPTQDEIDDVTAEHAKEWMLKYKMAKPGQAVNLTSEIAKLQFRAGIDITGKLDDATKRLFLIPRCGVAESEDAEQDYGSSTTREKRFTLQGSYWQKKGLTYRFLSSTSDLPEDVQRNILRTMISKWEKASTLTIQEAHPSVSDDDVEILISFVRRYHGDPYSFDGQGGTLAHAYYPHNNRGFSGDAHFDDDEFFTTGTPDGINLDWVAVHEFGHSMGLEHSNVRESIMYPWYKGYFPNIELTSDDIKGIQALYGKPTPITDEPTTQPDTTTKATTTEIPTTQPATTTKATTTEIPTTQPDTTTKATTTELPTTQPETTTKATTTEIPTTQPDTTTKATTTEKPTTQPETTTKATTTEIPTTQPETTAKVTTTETPTTQPDTTTKATTTETPTTEPDTTTKATTTEITTTQPATTTKASTTEAPTTEPDTTTKATTTEAPTKATTTETPTTQPDTTAKVTTKATTQISTERPTTPLPVLEICRVEKFDAFVMGIDRKTYVFSGDYFWVLGVRLSVESGPTKITSKWKELRTPISSAYTNWDGRIVFFKGNQYWKYFEQRLEEGPRDISKLGLPSDLYDPDAAFIWEGNYKTYFFKGENYWRYNENYKSVDPGYPRHISIWGLPFSVDSAISWVGNKRTYFFRDADYWKLDDGTLTLVSGYPRDITKIWMSCPT